MNNAPTDLELELLEPGTRASSDRLRTLLHESFLEIGQSGQRFNRDAILAALRLETPSEIRLHASEITCVDLAADVVLLTYLCTTIDRTTDEAIRASWRSSIWKKFDADWKLLFHQGTTTDDWKLDDA